MAVTKPPVRYDRAVTLPGFERPLAPLPMLHEHAVMIVRGEPRPKTKTLRSCINDGRYALMLLGRPYAVVRLDWLGEIDWTQLSTEARLRMARDEGHPELEEFERVVRAVYRYPIPREGEPDRSVGALFFSGERTLHSHRIHVERVL